jgi:hypothetical protein
MSRNISSLIRVYDFANKLLFLESSNSPVGKAVGVILQTDNEEWSFFSDRHCGYPLWQLQAICNKITILNANSHAERQHEPIAHIKSTDL